jgi:hypothetical protein
VECAHRLLRGNAPDSAIQRWGQKLCERGGKNAQKRAIVAVARKLAVLLHKLWVTQQRWEPLYGGCAGDDYLLKTRKTEQKFGCQTVSFRSGAGKRRVPVTATREWALAEAARRMAAPTHQESNPP